MRTRVLIAVLAATLLAGCPAATTPKTPREAVASCYYSVRAAYDTATDMRARGKLSDAQRANVIKVGDQATLACDSARAALSQGDVATAEGRLQAATALLLQLEAALKEK